jgi:hypothetical protein
LIFLVIAFLLVRSAISHNAAVAGGLEQPLDFLSPTHRRWIACGLMLFGAMSLVEARFRRIHRPPPIDHVADKVSEKVGN